jgi:polyhydroxyalkanoate synthesis regulator phasin
MLDVMRKAMLAGIGALTLSEQKARVIINDLVEQGRMSSEEGEKLARELMEKADLSRRELEEKVGEYARELMAKVDFVKRSEYEELLCRVEDLERRLAALTPDEDEGTD